MLRLYLDEDSMSTGLVRALRDLGFDVLTAEEAGTRRYSDESQLEFASGDLRAILTRNVRDYRVLHSAAVRSSSEHAGIILLTDPYAPIGLQVRCLQRLAERYEPAELRNRVIFLLNFA